MRSHVVANIQSTSSALPSLSYSPMVISCVIQGLLSFLVSLPKPQNAGSTLRAFARGYKMTTAFSSIPELTIFSAISNVSKSLLPLADLLILLLYHMYVPNLCLHLLFKSSFLSQQVVHDKLKKGPTFKTRMS